jgi:hypothetical protein
MTLTAHAAVAAALVEADLVFVTSVGPGSIATTGTRSFQLAFALANSPDQFFVTMYVSGVMLVAIAPIRVSRDANRQELYDAVALRGPFARLLGPLPGAVEAPRLFVEATAPLPPAGSTDEIRRWLVIPTLTAVSATVQYLITKFPNVVSVADEPTDIPFLSTEPGVPSMTA